MAGLCLAGCAAAPPPRVDDSLVQLRSGRAALTCREACVDEWRRVQPQAAQLETGGRSQELAALVLRVGYQDDLSLYYLGRAAEGLGYRAAAASYYRQAVQVSATAVSCQRMSRLCGGIVLPRMAAVRAAALERELARPRPRPAGGPPEPEPSGPPAEEFMPPPPPPAPAPIARPSGPPASEFIEPPAATR